MIICSSSTQLTSIQICPIEFCHSFLPWSGRLRGHYHVHVKISKNHGQLSSPLKLFYLNHKSKSDQVEVARCVTRRLPPVASRWRWLCDARRRSAPATSSPPRRPPPASPAAATYVLFLPAPTRLRSFIPLALPPARGTSLPCSCAQSVDFFLSLCWVGE